MTIAIDGNSKTHIDTHTHTTRREVTYLRNNFPKHFIKMQSVVVYLSMVCVYLTVTRVGLWSFPGHTHFFDQTHMTFRTHLALTFTFVGIALHTLNWLLKRPNYSQTLLTHYLLLPPKSVFSKQYGPRCGFCSGYLLYAKTNTIFSERNT